MGKKVVAMTEMISLSEQLVLNITKGRKGLQEEGYFRQEK